MDLVADVHVASSLCAKMSAAFTERRDVAHRQRRVAARGRLDRASRRKSRMYQIALCQAWRIDNNLSIFCSATVINFQMTV
jgi:hypothetical protein